ncbi:MAG: DUF4097 family beta strand repeat-containing protein [bacterium]
MKNKVIICFVILFSVFFLLTGCNSTYQEERYFTEDYRPGMTLKVKNSVGDIEIRRSPQENITILTNIEGYGSSINEAKQIVEKTEIRRDWRGDQLFIDASSQNSSFSRGRSVTYTISIPMNFNAEIETSTGDIIIEEIEGNVDLETSTGDIYIESLFGDIKGKTSTGDLIINYFEGEMDINTSTGDIKIALYNKANSNNTLRASTGDIELAFFEDPSAYFEIRTSTGDINYFGQNFEDELQAGRNGSSAFYNIRTSTGYIYLGYR